MIVGHSVGDHNGRIIEVDENVCELLHRSRKQLIGTSYVELTHPDDRELNSAKLDELRSNRVPFSFRKRYLRPDGSSVLVDLHVSMLRVGQDAGRLVGTLSLPGEQEEHASPRELWRRVCAQIRLVNLRTTLLGGDFMADHAWTIMLHIYLAESEGRLIDVRSLAGITTLPPASARRWMEALRDRMLIERNERDELQLTTTGLVLLENILGASE
ncbi:MAG: PAS domain-containing protein [Sphingobium sp.]